MDLEYGMSNGWLMVTVVRISNGFFLDVSVRFSINNLVRSCLLEKEFVSCFFQKILNGFYLIISVEI